MDGKSVFISRELKKNSPFRNLLKDKGYTVYGIALIGFSPVIPDSIPESDWIFFSSPRAVYYFFSHLLPDFSLQTPCAAIGPGTAKQLKAMGVEAEFVGNGDPKATAGEFLLLHEGKKVLFPRAQNSLRSIQEIMNAKITAIDLVVYNNQPLKYFDVPPCHILVFTSPLNVKTYFSKYKLTAGQKIVAIGKTTAQALKGTGCDDFIIADWPSEERLAEAVLKF